jgi:hypothetical protein
MARSDGQALCRGDGGVAHILPSLAGLEEATDRGFIATKHEPGHGTQVAVTPLGAEHLRQHRQVGPAR